LSPKALSFWVGFFADNGGAPQVVVPAISGERRRALSGATYTIDRVNQRLDAMSRCQQGGLQAFPETGVPCALYDYSVTLSTPFPVAPGRYWLWIQAD